MANPKGGGRYVVDKKGGTAKRETVGATDYSRTPPAPSKSSATAPAGEIPAAGGDKPSAGSKS